MSDETHLDPRDDPNLGATATVRTEYPGRDDVRSGRTRMGDAGYRRDVPHLLRTDRETPIQEEHPHPRGVAPTPPNASGTDKVSADAAAQPIDRESAYDRRPAEDKDEPPA
jgi:hypothetical protein